MATRKPGSTKVQVMKKGPNKGDTHRMKIARGGHPFPVAVLKDKGNNSTLKNNSGVKFRKKK